MLQPASSSISQAILSDNDDNYDMNETNLAKDVFTIPEYGVVI